MKYTLAYFCHDKRYMLFMRDAFTTGPSWTTPWGNKGIHHILTF